MTASTPIPDRTSLTELLEPGALERAIAWASAAYRACDVCAERCGVDRIAAPGGVCGLGEDARIYKEYIHFGEERRLLPSHTVYLSGCNFRCAFCSDWDQVVAPLAHGVAISPRALGHLIARRRAEGARNVNFVGGLPDVNVLFLLRALAHAPSDTHVVWNTNLWTTETAIDHLVPLVGTWLVDLKFGDGACGRKLSRARDYWPTVTHLFRYLLAATRQHGRAILVRHLLMPGHLACCTEPVLRWLAEVAREVPVNLMTGYLPYRMSRGAGAARAMGGRVPAGEIAAALSLFERLGFVDAMVDGVECARDEPGWGDGARSSSEPRAGTDKESS